MLAVTQRAVGPSGLLPVAGQGALGSLQLRHARRGRPGAKHTQGAGPHGRSGRRAAGVARASSEPLLREGGSMALPLDYYKLLGVSGVCSRDTLARALEKALSTPPIHGYSQQCLLARGSLLKRVVETLLETRSRRAYDDALLVGNITEEVPDEFVPGVLALLLEAGEAQTVVAAGEEWLATHRRDPRAHDVALSTALAHLKVAEELIKKQGDAASAALMLEVASDLLSRHRAAPSLQAEVADALAELQPALACQLVALPVEHFQERERGIEIAIAVLTDSSGSKKGMGKQQFLESLAQNLTAAEQIDMYAAAGRRYAELPSELYDVALAHIAEAASRGQPQLLEGAFEMLAAAAAAVPPGATGQASDSGVRQLAERRAIDERHRRQVAFAVCELLLGETQSAADAMGLLPGSPDSVKCERSLLAFIKANSPDPEDLLPGLCVLVQRWVADVALGSFRGTQGAPFSLEGWFEKEEVGRYLTRRRLGPVAASPIVSVAQRAGSVLTTPLVEGMAAVLSLMGLLLDPEQQAEEEEDAQYHAQQEEAATAAAGGYGGATSAPVRDELPLQAREMPVGRSEEELNQAAAGPDMSEVDMRAARQARARAIKLEDLKPRHTARPELTAAANAPPPPIVPPAALPIPDTAAGGEFDANVAFALQPVEQLTPLEGEERMWDSRQARTVRWGRLAATTVLLASGGFLLGRGMLMRSNAATAAQQLLPPTAPVAAAVVAEAPAAAVKLSLSRQQAAKVVAQWQASKARALGPEHDIKGLSTILRGEVLRQWQERAQQIQKKGWHYLHTMEGSQINSVTVDAAAGVARVSATFREAVVAHRGVADPVQAFRSEYLVDYDLASEDGNWVIIAAQVRS